jgi:membrane protein required for beta-lactamase induction
MARRRSRESWRQIVLAIVVLAVGIALLTWWLGAAWSGGVILVVGLAAVWVVRKLWRDRAAARDASHPR